MAEEPISPVPSAPPVRRISGRKRLVVALLVVLGVPIAAFSLYTAATLTWSYSDGNRVGITQKFSRKGWISKTWEGELAMTTLPGVAPTIWAFTVRDKAVAKTITETLGRKVSLHYTEHRGVPTRLFGETAYFVDEVRPLE